MIYDFQKLSKDLVALNSQDELSQYLEFYFTKIEQYFDTISEDEIQEIKFDIEDLLYDMLDNKLILKSNPQTINAFLILLAEKFMQTSLIGAITIIKDYLPSGITSKRLEASRLYLRVNDIAKDYFHRCDDILTLLESAAVEDEYSSKSQKSFFYFVKNVFYQFYRVNNPNLAQEFFKLLEQKLSSYTLLQNEAVKNFIKQNANSPIETVMKSIFKYLQALHPHKTICNIKPNQISKEMSDYSKKLESLTSKSFDAIRDIAYKYIQSIGDPDELFYKLQRGEAIIDDEKLLYKYLVSFGGKHKVKLYSAYEQIISTLQNKKFNIVDWGAGQATATMVLLDYAKVHNIKLDIQNITLIEPSLKALNRGLLHIDILKQKEYNIKAINSDLDCLDENDIKIDNDYPTLHLFSNILDLETFSLDEVFFKKVSKYIDKESIFICISPNRNDKLNNRLEIFYKYFDEHFDTTLISSRDDTIQNTTRYEKIFMSKAIVEDIEVVEEKAQIESQVASYQIDIINELSSYENYVEPILNMKLLEDAINVDPEYAIYKVRKVAEVITSNIYSNYESNAKQVSFNDKIRYLAYEKKVFDKTIKNYAETIRTIGNSGVHEDDRAIAKLKLDAHLVIIALVSFMQELIEKKLIN